jgi:DNA-directed RNA polymerase subunit M/transcription elongation factor TFIIS
MDVAYEQESAPEEGARICPNCGNEYSLVLANQEKENGTSGYLQCTACGMFTEI